MASRRSWASLLAGLLIGCASLRGGPPGATPPVDDRRTLDLESFDVVWETLRQAPTDPVPDGLDWMALREELRPRVENADSRRSARAVIDELLDRLGQSHFAIIPADVYGEMRLDTGDAEGAAGGGVTGISIRLSDGAALVVAVDERAAAKGVRPGWQLLEVDGRPVAPLIERIDAEFRGSTMLEAEASLAIERLLGGTVGSIVEARFLDERERGSTLRLPRFEPRGTPARFGHLPTLYVEFRSRRLEGGVGYIAFNAFLDPTELMASFAGAIESFMDAPGIILDLRGNPGGLGAMAMGIGSWFVDQPDQRLGTMTTGEVTLNFVLNPRARTYDGPLAILIDGRSMSTSEILAGGLKDLGRARIFGTASAGAALPSVFTRLPNGDAFQHAIANYVSVGGQRLEGHGVTPHVRVAPDRETLLAGQDPVVVAAVDWIRSQAAGSGVIERVGLGSNPLPVPSNEETP